MRLFIAFCVCLRLGEARAVEVTANWLNPLSGNWNSTTAWSIAPLFPNNNATTTFVVNIAAVGVPYQVMIDSGSTTVDRLSLNSSSATIAQSGGTLAVGTATLSEGTYSLLGNGTLSIAGVATFGNVTTVIKGGFLSGAGELYFSQQTQLQNAYIAAGGTLHNLAGGTVHLGALNLNRPLVNHGTIRFETGSVSFLRQGQFINRNVVEIATPTLSFQGELINDGTVLYSATSVFGSGTLINQGTVDVGNVSANAPSVRQTGAARYVGEGTLTLSNGFDIAGTASFETATTIFNGGTITGAGEIHSSRFMRLTNNCRVLSGGLLVNESSGRLELGLGTFLRNTANSGTLVVGTTRTSSGSLLASLANTGTMLFRGDVGAVLDGGPVTNDGTIVSTGGWLASTAFTNNGVIRVDGNGTLTIEKNCFLTAASSIIGSGSFNITAATLTLLANSTIETSGMVMSGTLNGPGALTRTGTTIFGTVQLNSTFINAGTLIVLGMPASNNVNGQFVNHGNLSFVGGTSTLSNDLVNTGTLDVPLGQGLAINSAVTGAGDVKVSGMLVFAGTTVSQIRDLTVASTGTLNLGNSDLVLEPLAQTATLSNLRTWAAGMNLFTPSAGKAIGYATASSLGKGTGDLWKGQVLTGDSIIVTPSFRGDANLDGSVNTTDFNNLAGSFGQTGTFWINGDFNYDGNVSSADFNHLIANYGNGATAAPILGTMIPEPAAGITLAALCAMRLCRSCGRNAL